MSTPPSDTRKLAAQLVILPSSPPPVLTAPAEGQTPDLLKEFLEWKAEKFPIYRRVHFDLLIQLQADEVAMTYKTLRDLVVNNRIYKLEDIGIKLPFSLKNSLIHDMPSFKASRYALKAAYEAQEAVQPPSPQVIATRAVSENIEGSQGVLLSSSPPQQTQFVAGITIDSEPEIYDTNSSLRSNEEEDIRHDIEE